MRSKEKLRILFVTGAIHKKHMRNLNHFQRVYFLSRWSELSILGVKNSDFSLSADAGTKIYRSLFSNKTASLVYFFAWILIRGREGDFDLVITEPSLYSVLGFWARMILRTKWVVDVWDIPIRNQSDRVLMRLKTRFERWILKILFRWADLFIVSILPEYELHYFKLPSAKMLLLKNAIWLDEISRKEYVLSSGGPFEILCMRSMYTVYSGLDVLAQAYHSVCKDLDVSLTIIGKIPGRIRSHLDVLVGCLGVHFFDFIEHDRLLEMIRNASVCIIPYKNVPDLAQIYPVKLLEYMALGGAVIAPDMGGFARMIRDGRNGLLFKPGDPEDLARQISTLYNDSELRRKISQNAQQGMNKEYDCEEKNRIILSRLKILVDA
jgi:glycosyltransferase involved in cell wall biosynthesis